MSHMDEDLRDLLRRRADDVPPHREVPRSLAGRAHRRIALNSLGAVLTVVVLAGGALAGLRTFGAARAPEPAAQRTTPASTTAVCTSAQLRAVGSMEGAAGSREGGISLENLSNKTCTLRGTPTFTL